MKNNTAVLQSQFPQPLPARELIEQAVPLVKSITARLRLIYGFDFSFDELYSIGIDGLIRAAENFDQTRGTSFTTYAYHRIRGTILDSLRRKPEFQRGSAREGMTIGRAPYSHQPANDNARALDRPASSPDHVRWAFADATMLRLSAPQEIGAIADDSAVCLDEQADRRRLAERMASALSTLPEMERRVLELRYYEDLSFAEIAEKLGICKPWAFRLHNKALRALKDELEEMCDVDELVAIS